MTEAVPTTQTTATPITLTAEAATRLRDEIARRGSGDVRGLRLMVFPGGCAGLSYALSFAKGDAQPVETVVESEGVRIYVETDALDLLRGSRISFVDNLIGGGFRVENPNAHHTCGCGKSFG